MGETLLGVHGGDIHEMCRRFNKKPSEILDYSTNINPDAPEKALKAAKRATKRIGNYPDTAYTSLRQAVCDYIHTKRNYIIPGNGATEIIYLAIRAAWGDRVGILSPTFSEYERACRIFSKKIVKMGFDYADVLKNLDNFDTLVICNPNNPDGQLRDLKDIMDLMKINCKTVIVDETFIEFSSEEDKYSLIKHIEDYENLIVIRAVTKFFGMPGIRFGYGVCSNKKLMKTMYDIKEPWSVNEFANTMCKAAFTDEDFVMRTKKYYREESLRVYDRLKELRFINAEKSEANFILCKIESNFINSAALKDEMFKSHNILIRNCESFAMGDKYFRIAIKSREDNDRVIDALRDTTEYIHCLMEKLLLNETKNSTYGSLGEIVQGLYGDGECEFIYRIPKKSEITMRRYNVGIEDRNQPQKVQMAIREFLKYYSIEHSEIRKITVDYNSEIKHGKGMSSSSADIITTLKNMYFLYDIKIDDGEMIDIAVKIEPTDPVHLEGFCLFNTNDGKVVKDYGPCDFLKERLDIIVLEPDETINTIELKESNDYKIIREMSRNNLKHAFELLDVGLREEDLQKIGRAGVISARENDKIVPKPFLEDIIKLSEKHGFYGVNIAHTGTAVAVLMDRKDDETEFIRDIKKFGIDKYYKKIYRTTLI